MKKFLCGKGFQFTVFSNLSDFNTLNGNTSDNASDRQPELNLILGHGKHLRRKGQENVVLSKREMGKKIYVDDRSKY